MTFQDEIQKVCSQRFVLARLEPARFINDFLSNPSPNIYTMSLPGFVISKVQRSGSDLTKVTTPSSNGQWSFDESTGLLTIYSTSAPNTTDNVFVVFYYLFYATDYDREYPQDVTSGDSRLWQGRITKAPSVSQSVNNIASSFVVTSSTSTLAIANGDHVFESKLTDKDSFANKNADTWIVVNDEIQKTFTGKIVSINLTRDTITINLNDVLNLAINETPFLGDTIDQALATVDEYPDVRGEDRNKPIPMIFGRTNQFETSKGNVFGSTPVYIMSTESKYVGINTDTTIVTADDEQMEFVLCRIPLHTSLSTATPIGFVNPSDVQFEHITELGNSNGLGLRSAADGIRFSGDVTDEIDIGRTFTYTTANGTFNAVVSSVDYLSGPDQTSVGFYSDQKTFPATVIGGSDIRVTAVSFTANPTVMISNLSSKDLSPNATDNDGNDEPSGEWLPLPSTHYTTSVTTQNNSKIVKITFSSNWHTEILQRDRLVNSSSSSFDTSINQKFLPKDLDESYNDMTVHFKIYTDNAISNHSDVLKYIVEGQGLSVDTASFTSAKSAFDADTLFSIPFVDSLGDLKPLKTYLERILISSIGLIYADTDANIVYKLLDAPSAGDTITDNEYLSGSLSVSLSYRDIVNSIVYKNEHEPLKGFYSQYDGSITDKNDVAKHLHTSEKTSFIDHVLADISTDSRYQKLLELRSERFVNYKFSTSAQCLLKNIFDDITISDPSVLGGSGSVNTKITQFTKDDDKVSITVSDLLGL